MKGFQISLLLPQHFSDTSQSLWRCNLILIEMFKQKYRESAPTYVIHPRGILFDISLNHKLSQKT